MNSVSYRIFFYSFSKCIINKGIFSLSIAVYSLFYLKIGIIKDFNFTSLKNKISTTSLFQGKISKHLSFYNFIEYVNNVKFITEVKTI